MTLRVDLAGLSVGLDRDRLAMLLAVGRRLRDGVSPDWIDWAEMVEAELSLNEAELEELASIAGHRESQ